MPSFNPSPLKNENIKAMNPNSEDEDEVVLEPASKGKRSGRR
jgi:hypothetical protein